MRVPTVRLADVTVRIGSGITPRGGSAVYKAAGRPFVRSQNVGWGDLLLDDIAYIDEATHMTFPATEIWVGDVLLNITGASIGRSAVATSELAGGNVNQHVCEIRLRRGIMDPYFVNAVLLSRTGQDQIDAFQAGGNRQGLNFQQVGSIEVPDVDFRQQRLIGAAYRDCDENIAVLERLIAKKHAIKQGMMQQLLTGRTRLPGFTNEWESGPLKDFMPLQRGFDLPTTQVRSGPYPVVYSNGIARYHEKAMVRGPGIITGRSGTIGKVHFVEVDYWPHNTALWVTSFARVNVRFAYYFLVHLGLERFASGSGVPTLNRNDAHSFDIRVPSDRREQEAIGRVLTDVDEEISVLEKRLSKAKDIMQGMMQQLLTGRMRLPVETAS